MIEVEVSYYYEVNCVVYRFRGTIQLLKSRVAPMVIVEHMNTNVKHDCSSSQGHAYTGTTHLLSCSQTKHLNGWPPILTLHNELSAKYL